MTPEKLYQSDHENMAELRRQSEIDELVNDLRVSNALRDKLVGRLVVMELWAVVTTIAALVSTGTLAMYITFS